MEEAWQALGDWEMKQQSQCCRECEAGVPTHQGSRGSSHELTQRPIGQRHGWPTFNNVFPLDCQTLLTLRWLMHSLPCIGLYSCANAAKPPVKVS
eukprot:365744-Chlamydomonas_euryale.AAC.6